MTSQKHNVIVLGSGLAGLRATIEAAHSSGLDVAIDSTVQLIRYRSICGEVEG